MTTVLEPEITIVPEPSVPAIPEVERGAAWLDENVPGWWHQIDLGTLNLASCELCISAQLALEEMLDDPEGCGCESCSTPTRFPSRLGMDATGDWSFAQLQVAWEHEIARRREAA